MLVLLLARIVAYHKDTKTKIPEPLSFCSTLSGNMEFVLIISDLIYHRLFKTTDDCESAEVARDLLLFRFIGNATASSQKGRGSFG
jgi:hypothetical protein